MRIIFAVGVLLVLTSCAKKAENVAATYVSPNSYQGYSCHQIAQEGQRVSARVAELTGVQNKKRTGDVVATTASIVLFWPALFFISGDDEKTAELARLKGEYEALQKVAVTKNCSFAMRMEPVRR